MPDPQLLPGLDWDKISAQNFGLSHGPIANLAWGGGAYILPAIMYISTWEVTQKSILFVNKMQINK